MAKTGVVKGGCLETQSRSPRKHRQTQISGSQDNGAQRADTHAQTRTNAKSMNYIPFCAPPLPAAQTTGTGSLRCSSGSFRAQCRVRIHAVNVPIFGGFPLGNPTKDATASKLFQGESLVQVRFRGVPSTVEKVVRVGFCCLLS